MDATVVISQAEAKKAEQKENLKTLQRNQQKAASDGKELKTADANRAKGVKVKDHEKNLVHVELESRSFNDTTRQMHTEKRVVKIQPRIFEQMVKDNAFVAYDEAKVIHDPRPNAPKEQVLKQAIDLAPGLGGNEAALAAREQKLKDQEKRIAEAEARLDEKLKAIEGSDKSKNNKGEQLPPPPQV